MKRLQIFGATASPYTQKMLALMRYRRIPYDIHWGETKTRLDNLKIEAPKPVLLPVMLLENQEKMTKTDLSDPKKSNFFRIVFLMFYGSPRIIGGWNFDSA